MPEPAKTFPDYYVFGRADFEMKVADVNELDKKGQNSACYATGDIDWHLNVCSTEGKSGKALSAYLYCDAVDVANWWKVNAEFRIVLKSKISKLSIARQMDFCFECEESENHGWKEFAFYDDILDKRVGLVGEDDSVVFRVMIGVTSVEGFYTPKYFNFNVPEPGFSDFIITVDRRKFHVNRMHLSVHSPVFTEMVGDDNELTIDNATADEFHDFLQLLYAVPIRICKNNVTSMLKMAIRFETHGLRQSCEDYLMYAFRCDDMEKCTILKVAQENKLENVMNNIINSIGSIKEMKEKLGNYEDLPAEVLDKVIKRSLSLA